MGRCGCVGNDCNCAVVQGPGISIDGVGSTSNPHIVNIGQGSMRLAGLSTAYLTVDVNGLGTSASPYSIQMLTTGVSLPSPVTKVDQFLTSGTWVRPVGRTLVHVYMLGGGQGGGGGGRSNSPVNDGLGGDGGSGGGWVSVHLNLPVTVTDAVVTVGSGGSGGIGRTYYVGSLGGAGGDSQIVFRASGIELFSVTAKGAASTLPGVGTRDGQVYTGLTAVNSYRSGVAGGGGGVAQMNGGALNPVAPGTHVTYTDTNPLLMKGAGPGGIGGFADVYGTDGEVGGVGSGGGGGGGTYKVGLLPAATGGNGGAGGPGAVWIVSL